MWNVGMITSRIYSKKRIPEDGVNTHQNAL